jgi:GNAT superfamily N-acetyltransferase
MKNKKYRLKEMTPEEVCSAINKNLLDLCRLVGETSSLNVNETPEMFLVSHGVPYPAYQGVLDANISSDEINTKIDQVVQFFASQGLPPTWYVHPVSKPDDLEIHLKAKGFSMVASTKGMACDLKSMDIRQKKPDGLIVEYVEDESSLRTFFDIWTEGHPFPKPLGDAWFNFISETDYGPDSNTVYYLGYYDGKPVATAVLFLDGSSAGLWWIVTLEKMRGKGIGTWMTIHPLKEAKEKGYELSVLNATELGLPIYKKLGYTEFFINKLYVLMG